MFNFAKHNDFFENLQKCDDLAALEKIAFAEFAKNEVSSVFYGAVSTKSDFLLNKTKNVYSISNHPDKWFDQLGLDTCLDNEITANLAVSTKEPILWHDESNWSDASKDQIDQALYEKELGMYSGITMPLSAFNQKNIAMIGISTSGVNEKQFDLFWTENSQNIIEVSEITNLAIQLKHMPEICKSLELRARHYDFMKYRMEGLSNKNIAFKMKISFHGPYRPR